VKSGLAFLLTLVLTLPAAAQIALIYGEDKTPAAPPGEQNKSIKLKVHPAAEPVPALRYRLYPEVLETEPGNAALLYYRAFSPEWRLNLSKEMKKTLNDWLDDRKKDPPEELRFVLQNSALKQLDLAARKRYCEWDLFAQLKTEGVALLLPELQGFREQANWLALRARFEMADGDHDKAVQTLRTGIKFGKDIAGGPTLIHALVGIAVTRVMLHEVETLMQQKGSPNLYWALTDLPRPYISLREQFQSERAFFDQMFPGLRKMAWDLESKPLGPAELDAMVSKFLKASAVFEGINNAKENWTDRLGLAVLAAKAYPYAKEALIKQGRPAEVVNAMPVLQVAMLYEVQNYERYFDDMSKWYGLPYLEAKAGIRKTIERLTKEIDETGSTGLILAKLLIPASEAAITSTYLVDRSIAGLRCVEAIRLYAAAHEGKLPASLDDIKEVPVPVDPFTGNSFVYQVKGDTAFLIAPAPAGEAPVWQRNYWKYEITIER
jgi:hypothetical protein